MISGSERFQMCRRLISRLAAFDLCSITHSTTARWRRQQLFSVMLPSDATSSQQVAYGAGPRTPRTILGVVADPEALMDSSM